MKRGLVYRPEALADLDEAAAYKRGAWNERQARRYIAALVADIKALRLSALRYPLYEQIIPGLRRKRSGMHHIYYFASADQVEVVRILHVQQDPGLHLKAETWRGEE